jgi:hypothetical protein
MSASTAATGASTNARAIDRKPFGKFAAGPRSDARRAVSPNAELKKTSKVEKSGPAQQKILFQNYFKSVGPRTYAAQVKEAGNGNHYLVLTEGKRDESTGDIRKTRLFVFSEDFDAFFKLIDEAATFVRAHPLPDDIKRRQDRYWAKKARHESKPSA